MSCFIQEIQTKLIPECVCRPTVLGSNMANYPWLADSWPTANSVHSGKEAINCCTTSRDTVERYYNGMFTMAFAWKLPFSYWLDSYRVRMVRSSAWQSQHLLHLCRSRYLQLPEPDGEVQHGWLHWRSYLQHHRCHQWRSAQLQLCSAHFHRPLCLHLHHAVHQPDTGDGPWSWPVEQCICDHAVGSNCSSVCPAWSL